MEALQKALERESQKKTIEKPPIIKTVNDIVKIIDELNPTKNHPIKTVVNTTVNYNNNTYALSAPTSSKSKRDYLIEGLSIIKNQSTIGDELSMPIIINDKEIKPISLGDNSSCFHWVDKLIKQWLNGYRDKEYICWDLTDGYKYIYNIWDHKLNRIKKA